MPEFLERLTHEFRQSFNSAPAFIARAPGRVNLLGEHVDYNDGWVLPVAIDRAAYLAVGRCPSDLVSLWAMDLNESAAFRVTELEAKVDASGKTLPGWAKYPAGVAWSLKGMGLDVGGMDAVLTSTVPQASGLSSSAALEVVFAAAWQALGGWSITRMELARACQRAENQYVGVNSGLMDQFASAHGRAGHALLLDCRTLEWEAVPLPPEVAIVVADTKVRRELSNSAYNERFAQCQEAVRVLKTALPEIRALRDVSVEDFNLHARLLAEPVRSRARHVVEECERTRRGATELKAGNVRAFGELMKDGHRSLRDLYAVSVPPLDLMAETAWSLPGCYGARLTGAGFGGCTVSLVHAAVAEDFRRELSARYQRATGIRPDIYLCAAAEGAGLLE